MLLWRVWGWALLYLSLPRQYSTIIFLFFFICSQHRAIHLRDDSMACSWDFFFFYRAHMGCSNFTWLLLSFTLTLLSKMLNSLEWSVHVVEDTRCWACWEVRWLITPVQPWDHQKKNANTHLWPQSPQCLRFPTLKPLKLSPLPQSPHWSFLRHPPPPPSSIRLIMDLKSLTRPSNNVQSSNNYGIWGQTPDGKGPKPGLCSMVYSLAIRLTEISGNCVKLSTSKLRKQLLSVPQNTVLVVCYQGGRLELVGHAFVTAWDYDGGKPILKINCYCSNPFVVRPCWLGHTARRQPLYSQTVHHNIPPPNVEVACSLPWYHGYWLSVAVLITPPPIPTGLRESSRIPTGFQQNF